MNPPVICHACKTSMVLIDKQSVDERHEVLFFRCSSCGATVKRVIGGVAFAPLGQLHGVSS